jgi:plastocyanin
MTTKRLLPLVPVLGFIATGGLPCHWQSTTVPAAAADSSGPQEVRVNLAEWSLSPDRFQVVPGVPVRLLATNGGALTHALAVEGDGLYAETQPIASHQTARLELTFSAPGLYDVYCPIAAGEHRALGQDGKIAAGPEAADLLDLTSAPAEEPALASADGTVDSAGDNTDPAGVAATLVDGEPPPAEGS